MGAVKADGSCLGDFACVTGDAFMDKVYHVCPHGWPPEVVL